MSFILREPVRSLNIRRSAAGQPCTFQIPGICNFRWATTILAHVEIPKHGAMAGKASDIDAAYGCSSCHDLIDMRDERWPDHREHFEFYKRRAVSRTLHMLWDQGIIMIKGGGRDMIIDEDDPVVIPYRFPEDMP